MKRIATLSLCVISLYANAQNVKLETGKKLTAVSSMKMEMDMGEAGQMNTESSKTAVISITGTDAAAYKAEATLTKMKVSQDFAGQTMDYDSENKSDSSETAKALGKDLNQKNAVTINKTTGLVKDDSPEKPEEASDENPFSSVMGGNSPAAALANSFFVIPAGKKAGDTWSDSTTKDGMKTVRNYELQSLDKTTATISVKTVNKGMIEKEVQGMQMLLNMSGTGQSVYTIDPSTGIVKKNTTTGNMEGTMDIAGQSVPLTIKLNTSSSVE